MFLIAGLGNPGINYRYNRHNIGFLAIDTINHNISFLSKWIKSDNGLLSKNYYNNNKVILLFKPLSYMNNSGIPLKKIIKKYNISLNKILIIHDDLDLNLLSIKIKKGGGDGGHNGVRSISQHIGKNYYRIRIGIGRPKNKNDINNYVLSNFNSKELILLKKIFNNIANNLHLFFLNKYNMFTNQIINFSKQFK